MPNFQPAKQYIYYLRVWVHKEFVTTPVFIFASLGPNRQWNNVSNIYIKNLWLIIGHWLFFHHGGIDSDTEAIAQNTLPKKQPELRGEWRRGDGGKEAEGLIIPSWLIIIILSQHCERMCYGFCKC